MGRQQRGGGYGGGGSRGGGTHRGGWGGGRGGKGAWQPWTPQASQFAAPIDITGGGAPLGFGLGGQPIQLGLQGMQGLQGVQGVQGIQGAGLVAPVVSPAVLGQPVGLSADTQPPGLAQLAVQIQQGAGKGGIPLVLSDQTAMLLLQQGMQVADKQAKAASQAQADAMATMLDQRFGLSELVQQPTVKKGGKPKPKPKPSPTKSPPKVDAKPHPGKGKAKTGKQVQWEQEEEGLSSLGDSDVASDAEGASGEASKSKKTRQRKAARLRDAKLQQEQEKQIMQAQNESLVQEVAKLQAWRSAVYDRLGGLQQTPDGLVTEAGPATRSRTKGSPPSSTPSTPLKDILDEAQAKITVGPDNYEAVAAITRVAAQREHRRLEDAKAARKKKKEKPVKTEKAGKTAGAKRDRKGKQKQVESPPSTEGARGALQVKLTPNHFPSPRMPVPRDGEMASSLEVEILDTPSVDGNPRAGGAAGSSASRYERMLADEEGDTAGTAKNTAGNTLPGGSDDPSGGSVTDQVGKTLQCLGAREVNTGEKYLSLTRDNKLHCVVLGVVDCLQRCRDLAVDLPTLTHLEQESLEHEVSKELLQKSPYPLLSLEEQLLFSTTMMEGVSSKFGLKPDRRESLLKWMSRVVRLLQHNGIQWSEHYLLRVATDPYSVVPEHASVLKGFNIYTRLLTCKVMKIRVGIKGASAAAAAALADTDLSIAQLKQQMQELVEKKKAILQEDKHEKRSGKQ